MSDGIDLARLAGAFRPVTDQMARADVKAAQTLENMTRGGSRMRAEELDGVLPANQISLSDDLTKEVSQDNARAAWAGGNVTADAIFKNATVRGLDALDVMRWKLYSAFGAIESYDADGKTRVSIGNSTLSLFDATEMRRAAIFTTDGAIQTYDATGQLRASLNYNNLTLRNAAGATTLYIPSDETDTIRFRSTPTVGPLGSNVPVALAPLFAAQAVDYTGTNATGAQKVFNVSATGAVAVAAATAYLIDAVYHIHTTGTASHALQLAFGGTATLTSLGLEVHVTNTATEAQGADTAGWMSSAALTAVTPATATATHHTVRLRGIVRVNAAGTLIPQYGWSAAPGVAGVTLANSYLTLTPLGANTVTTVGIWT